MTDLQRFIYAVAENPNLQRTLSEYSSIDEITAKAVELGIERGLTFTEEDVRDYLSDEGELSDDIALNDIELDAVVAGVANTTAIKSKNRK